MTTTRCTATAIGTPAATDFAAWIAGIPHRVLCTVLAWQARAATRRHMAELDDHLLDDIGLSRADQMRESAKPFWKD